MPIKTSTAIFGFIASTPVLSHTETGDARLYAKIGQEHFSVHQDGTFSQDETSYHDLVMFHRSAEKAAAQFVKGDKFVAAVQVYVYTVTDDEGATREREEFVARHIGHDSAATRYSVERTPRVQQGPTNTTGAAGFPVPPQPPATTTLG